MRQLFILLCIAVIAFAKDTAIKESDISKLFMIGFYGTSVDKAFCHTLKHLPPAGVILFDYNPINKAKPKNIASKAQLKSLTTQLQRCSGNHTLLIAVDQEGGKVQRLKSKYGFNGKFPSAKAVSEMSQAEAKRIYSKMAKELKEVGINYNLAPVVDQELNPKNHVIKGLKRSYGKDPKKVAHYASLFIDAMIEHGILTALKHFPGHGSSLGDTHKGFVDVTNLWQEAELEPYKLLKDKAPSVMVAHVYNKRIDPAYPATLSKKTIDGLLRKKIGYQGTVITDDLQMGAIAKKYSLKTTIQKAIDAGNNILLFCNQLNPKKSVTLQELVATTKALIKEGKISQDRIAQSIKRIERLKKELR